MKYMHRGTSIQGHPRDQGKCPLNGRVSWVEVSQWRGFTVMYILDQM